MKHVLRLFSIALLLAGCAEREPLLAPEGASTGKLTLAAQRAGSDRLQVMTRNIYLGGDIDPIIQERNPLLIPVRVAEAWQTAQANNFPERAQALAAEIAAVQPHLIGLQEVALFRIQSPGDVLQGNPQKAQTVVQDYLDLLLAALAAEGLDYRPVAISTNADVELPLPVSTDPTVPLSDLRFTDRDVILAREDVRVSNAQTGPFAVNVQVSVGGIPVTITRGWAAVDARVTGQSLRFVNTHLEGRSGGLTEPIQIAQAAELEQRTRGLDVPVVLVGDLNSSAAGDEAPGISYGNLLAAGFVDVWTVANPGVPGLTADHPKNLRSETVEFNKRIDLILARPAAGQGLFLNEKRIEAEVVGDELADRTPSGLWPSDHAGVWAYFRLAPVQGPLAVR